MKFLNLTVMVLSFAFIAVSYSGAYVLSEESDVNVCVKSKERRMKSSLTENGTSISYEYIVWAENSVYRVDDSFLFMTFDSADRFNQIEEGSCYSVNTAGWRLPFIGMFKNIISINNKQG